MQVLTSGDALAQDKKPPSRLTGEYIRLIPNGSGLKQVWWRELREYLENVSRCRKFATARTTVAGLDFPNDLSSSFNRATAGDVGTRIPTWTARSPELSASFSQPYFENAGRDLLVEVGDMAIGMTS